MPDCLPPVDRDIVPHRASYEGFHVADAFNCGPVVIGPIEAERGAPVVKHQGDVIGHAQGFESGIKIAAMLEESVGVGAGVIEFVRITHANEIGGKASSQVFDVRHDVAP